MAAIVLQVQAKVVNDPAQIPLHTVGQPEQSPYHTIPLSPD